MNVTVLGWAPTKQAAEAFFSEVGIAKVDDSGAVIPTVECHIDSGVPCKKWSGKLVEDENGQLVPEELLVPGWHFNILFYGGSAEALSTGLAQFNEDGTWRSLFQRTRLLGLVSSRTGEVPTWGSVSIDGIPAGYEIKSPGEPYDGVRCFDPEAIQNQQRVFA